MIYDEGQSARLEWFPPIFFKRYQVIIYHDIAAAIQQFFSIIVMLEVRKKTYITSIPKRWDASEPIHYRLINLYTTLYIVVVEIMPSKMKLVISRLISLEQEAFVDG